MSAALLLAIGGIALVDSLNPSLFVAFIAGLSPAWLYGAGFALGTALRLFGLWLPLAPATSEAARQPHSLHPFHTFLLGAAVMVNERTTVLPYFVALERIASSGVSMVAAVALLALYNFDVHRPPTSSPSAPGWAPG